MEENMNPFKLLKEMFGLTEVDFKEKEAETKPQENTYLKNEDQDAENTSSFFSDEEDEEEELIAMAEADEEDEFFI